MIGRRVVLTGRGIVSPLGVGVEEHWAAVVEGACAVAFVPRLTVLGLPASRGAELAADRLLPHLSRLPRKQQKLYNPATLLGMLAASLATEEASLSPGAVDPRRFGVILGVNVLSWDLSALTNYLVAAESKTAPGTLDMAAANSFCMRNINPLDYSLKTLPNLAAGHLAIAYDAQGICRAMTEGPVGGAHAIGQAYRMIADDELDVAVCGGADAQIEELLFASYCGAGLLASDAGDRPGWLPGEGGGIAVLEEAKRAQARGARVHGEVLGFAIAAGDGHPATTDDGARLGGRLAGVIREVLAEADGAPDVVSLHGDGIASHEAAEEMALAQSLPGDESVARLRMKRGHGDLGAASTPVEFLACSAALKHAILPSVVSSRSQQSPRSRRRALVISLGLFGECAALMLGESGALNAY